MIKPDNQMPPDSEAEMGLANLLEMTSRQLAAGEEVDLHLLCREHPQYADELERLLPTIEQMARLTDKSHGHSWPINSRDAGDPDGDPPALGTLGDYEILGEIGRGGMGVVYRARQKMLGRDVAVKVLPLAALADQRQLARFRNEVQATAALHHPHIVPIHTVGVDRGIHYYAMQYIDGPSLAQIIDRLTTAEGGRDKEVEAGVPAPLTVQHDTLRDLQDSVVTERSDSMVDYCRTVANWGLQVAQALAHAHENGVVHRDIKPANLFLDERGSIWVADFGLAQLESGPTMTKTGDIVGTLRYVAPEQALGQKARVDQRVDVYSLGATLYELLVLRPAREGTNRQEMLKQFATTLPSPLRKIDPKIPTVLATIVGKAMEHEPADRYSTAEELANDLRRFLGNEPIEAKPPTRLQRLVKWAQRNRAVAWSAALSTAAVVVLAIVLLAINNVMIANERNQKDEALRDKDLALVEKEAALVEKEAALIVATRVLHDIYLKIVADRTLAPGTDEGSEAEWWGDTGRITSTEPLTDKEQHILEQVLRFYEQLTAQSDQLPQLRFQQIMTKYQVGRIYGHLGRTADMLKAKRQTVAALEQLVRDHPENSDSRYAFYWVRGQLSSDQQQWNVAIDDFSRALEIRPKDVSSWVSRANAYSRLGQNKKAVEDCSRAIALRPESVSAKWNRGVVYCELHQWEKAIQDFDEAIALDPDFPDLWLGRGDARFGLGQFEKAIADYTHAIEREPDQSCRYNARGRAHQELKQWNKAFADYSRAIELDPQHMPAWHNRGLCALFTNQLLQSVEDFSRAIELQPSNIHALVNRGAVYRRLGQLEKAIEDLSRSIELAPDQAKAFLSRGDCYVEQKQWEKALADFSRAIELDPDNARGWINRGGVYWRLKQMEAANQDLAHAVTLKPENAFNRSLRGKLFFDLGEWARALDDFSRAAEMEPNEKWHWWNLGRTHYRAGDYRSAIEALEKEIRFSGESFAYSAIYLAMAHWQLGEKELARKWYQKGVDRMKNDATPNPQLLRLRTEADGLMGSEMSN